MDYKNFINFILSEATNNLKESLNLNRECTPSILMSLSIHVGAMFIAQNWRVLSSSLMDKNNEDISQRLIISPKEMLENYVVVDICLFTQASHWHNILEYRENTTLISQATNHTIIGIAEGNTLIAENLPCNDTQILPPSEHSNRRILWHIADSK